MTVEEMTYSIVFLEGDRSAATCCSVRVTCVVWWFFWTARSNRKAMSVSSIETTSTEQDDFDDFQLPDLSVSRWSLYTARLI